MPDSDKAAVFAELDRLDARGRTTNQALEELLAASDELGNRFGHLWEETLFRRHLHPDDLEAFSGLADAILEIKKKAALMIRPVRTEPYEYFLKGVVVGLTKAGRPDLIAEKAEFERAAVLLEAELILKSSSPPPPIS